MIDGHVTDDAHGDVRQPRSVGVGGRLDHDLDVPQGLRAPQGKLQRFLLVAGRGDAGRRRARWAVSSWKTFWTALTGQTTVPARRSADLASMAPKRPGVTSARTTPSCQAVPWACIVK